MYLGQRQRRLNVTMLNELLLMLDLNWSWKDYRQVLVEASSPCQHRSCARLCPSGSLS